MSCGQKRTMLTSQKALADKVHILIYLPENPVCMHIHCTYTRFHCTLNLTRKEKEHIYTQHIQFCIHLPSNRENKPRREKSTEKKKILKFILEVFLRKDTYFRNKNFSAQPVSCLVFLRFYTRSVPW